MNVLYKRFGRRGADAIIDKWADVYRKDGVVPKRPRRKWAQLLHPAPSFRHMSFYLPKSSGIS